MDRKTNDNDKNQMYAIPGQVKVYKRRWLILIIFFCFTLSVSLQWGQYIIISNVVEKFYNVPSAAVDWTTVTYMIAYLVFLLPALWLLDEIGVRKTMILSSAGICLGAWVKFYASFSGDRYVYVMIGQSFEAVFQVLAFGLAARVCALWFGPNEVSMACALAVFGDQLGTALGFILPAVVVRNSDDLNEIGSGFIRLNLSISLFTSFILTLVIIYFKEAPKIPPSSAQVLQKISTKENKEVDGGKKNEVWSEINEIMTNCNFILMMLSYGINIGVFNAVITLLNHVFLQFFPHGEEHVGIIGFIIMIFGIVGSLLGGWFLDRTHLFKETTVFAYGCSFLTMIMYTFSLRSGLIAFVYLSAILFGFFVIGYYSVGIQMAIEVTYPVSESISSSLLLFASHVYGIIFTFLYRFTFMHVGDLWANLGAAFFLLIGTAFTAAIQSKLKRQNAENIGRKTSLSLRPPVSQLVV